MSAKISVVIGFRDWGLLRLTLAVQSIQRSFGAVPGEVIISDYGSTEPSPNRELAETLGAKYVFTENDGPWSRSRALNAGFAVAEGDFYVSTDADMYFSPKSFERIYEIAKSGPESAYFLQCWDLPESMDDVWVDEHREAWDEMLAGSRLRPRWGMGGMMAISREGFESIRGFDERLHTYGGEDLDFAQRARRAGYRTQWIDDPDVRMYHMWHPHSLKVGVQTPEAKAAVEYNRQVVYNDKTFVRNFGEWVHRGDQRSPLVTVAISTMNRADIISESIRSVLAQTVQDFEIVVVDDGGEDNLKEVIDAFGDSRIRYFWQENTGISGARNRILDESRGIYTAVLDDDDLMHPRRLEWHLQGLSEGLSGNVGSFVNFDDKDGTLALHNSMVPAVHNAFKDGTAPGHGTWFVKTDVLRKFRYDESLSSGVDNNLMLRMLRAGIKLGHVGRPVLLRRMHGRQVTATDSTNQSTSAKESLTFLTRRLGSYHRKKLEEKQKSEGAYPRDILNPEQMMAEAKPYLPDRLTSRDLVLNRDLVPDEVEWDGEKHVYGVEVQGYGSRGTCLVRNASYSDLTKAVELRALLEARLPDEDIVESPVDWIADSIGIVSKVEDSADLLMKYFVFSDDSLEGFDTLEVKLHGSEEAESWRLAIVNLGEVPKIQEQSSNCIIVGSERWTPGNDN